MWDHARSRVVWIGRGKDRDTLDAFFAKLGARRARKLVAVTMDMAQAYITAVQNAAPQADTSSSTASTSSATSRAPSTKYASRSSGVAAVPTATSSAARSGCCSRNTVAFTGAVVATSPYC